MRLTPGELAILRGRARVTGVSLATYLRQQALARRIRSRGSHLHQEDVDQLARLGTDLNRFAHAANATRPIVGAGELAELLAEIRSALGTMRAKLPS